MINFAHSDVYMVGAFMSYYAARILGIENNPGISTLITLLLVSMISCSLLGLAIERLAYRPLRKSSEAEYSYYCHRSQFASGVFWSSGVRC